MAINMLQLPGYQVSNPVDFAPIVNALDSNRQLAQANAQNALAQRQLGIQEQRLGMEKERHGVEMAGARRQQGVEAVRAFAGHAQSIEKMTDPAQRTAAWTRLLASHPDAANLPEIYRDPINGPRIALQEAQGFMGEMDKAQMGLIRGKTAAAYAQADRARRENVETGLVPQYMVGEDGRVHPFVMNKSGKLVPVQLPEGMRALGPGGTAEARAIGTATGQAKVDLPKVQEAAAATLRYIEDVEKDPNLSSVIGPWNARTPNIFNTGVQAKIDQLGGRAFLSAFESLKGGGQITEIEGRKATEALARLTTQTMSEPEYRKALADFRREVITLVEIAKQRASGGIPTRGPASGGQSADPLGIR